VDAILRREIVKKVKKHLTAVKPVKGEKSFTFNELTESLGYSQKKAYGLLHEWVANGEVKVVSLPATDIIGRPSMRPRYQFSK
jgi:hypothetical protein